MAMDSNEKREAPRKARKWEAMKLTYLGNSAELIQTSPGKLSAVGGDPGEGRKQSGGSD
jgi:hypothetical protein